METELEIKAPEEPENIPTEGADGARERDLAAEFAELIRGEYRDAFNAKVKEILIRRFRERARAEKQNAAGRHDDEERSEAADPAATAPPAGKSGEKAPDAAEAARFAREHPEIDLSAALADPAAARLMSAGLTLREALEFTCRESIADARIRAAEQRAAEQVRRELIAGMRPSENKRTGDAVRPSGVERMTLAQREELERRAMKGEKIIL